MNPTVESVSVAHAVELITAENRAAEFDGRQARIRFERSTPELAGTSRLQPVCQTDL